MRAFSCLLAVPALLAHPPGAGFRVLEASRSAVLVVVAGPGQGLPKAARQALRGPELAELDLGLVILDPARPGRELAELRAAVPNLAAPGWVLLAPSGRVLGSGKEAPGPAALATLLASAGFTAPIQVLQTFLRQHPEHLEARGDLLRLLRRGAAARTRARLGLAAPNPPEPGALRDPSGPTGPVAVRPDLSPFAGKRLQPVEDLEIWAAYAQELDRAFQNGSWRSLDLGMGPGQELAVEVCSPTLQALYARHLAKVEAVILTLPDSTALWQIWLRMTAVSGRNGGRALVQGLLRPPPEMRLPWPPPGVLAALVLDAQRSGDWWLVRDLLDPFWEDWRARLERARGLNPAGPQLPNGAASQVSNGAAPQVSNGAAPQLGFTPDWAGSLGPLLEAMIRIRADEEATLLVSGLPMLAETQPWLDRAVALASGCQRQDLARRWAALRR